MEVNQSELCQGSGLKTTNPITDGYFKTSVCTHCKGVRGVMWDYRIKHHKFHTHSKEGVFTRIV